MAITNSALDAWKKKYQPAATGESDTGTAYSVKSAKTMTDKALATWKQKYLAPVGETDLRDQSVREKYAARTEKQTTSGGYYSPPEDTMSGKYQSALIYAQYQNDRNDRAAQSALTDVQAKQSSLELVESHVQHLWNEYSQNGGEKYAEMYNNAFDAYESLYDDYSASAQAYEDAYAKYADGVSSYNRITNMYEQHAQEQQAAYNEWKSTIREQSAVQAEIDRLDAQIAALQRVETGGVELNLGTGAMSIGEAVRKYADEDSELFRQMSDLSVKISELQKQRELLDDELSWSQYYYYDAYTNEADFPEMSQYVSTATGEEPFYNARVGAYTVTGFGDIAYDVINRNEEAVSRNSVNNINMGTSFFGLDNAEREEMTDYEISIFNYLYARDEADGDTEHTRAWEYIDKITGDLNYRQREKREAEAAEYAKEHPVLASVGTVVASPLRGISYIGQLADYLDDGKIDQNAGYNRFSYLPKAVRQEVSSNWGAVGSFMYNTGMSLADFLMTNLVSGGQQWLSLAIMGTGAAADATIEAKDRGLSDSQAFALGTIAGIAEVVTEKISIEALLDKTSMGKSAVGYLLKNVLSEGGEEVGSDIINMMADIVISQDKSQWAQSMQKYRDEGRSEGEAFALAARDQAVEMGLDFLGGALSGGVMAGANLAVNSTYNAVTQARTARAEMKNQLAQQAQLVKEQKTAKQETGDVSKLERNEAGTEVQTADETSGEVMNLRTAAELEKEMPEIRRAETVDADTEAFDASIAERGMTESSHANVETQQPEVAGDAGTAGKSITERSGRESGASAEGIGSAERVSKATLESQMQNAETAENSEDAGTAGESITERSGREAGASAESIGEATRISEAIGRTVVFFHEAGDADGVVNGYYDRSSGRIYVNTQSANTVTQIVAHELTHSIETTAAYQDRLSRYVLQRVQETADLAQLREQIRTTYAKKGVELSGTDVDAEIIADYVAEHLLTNEAEIQSLVRSNRTLGETIRNWIDRVLAKLGNASAKERAFLTKAREYYAVALAESSGDADIKNAVGNIREEMRQVAQAYANGTISEEEFDAQMDALMEEESMAGGNLLDYEMGVDSRSKLWYNNKNEKGGEFHGRGESGEDSHRRVSALLRGEQNSESPSEYRRSERVLSEEGRTGGEADQNVHRRDSEGRRLTESQAQQLRGTAVTTESGAPLAVYHFTPEMNFETFARGDIGFHFGTKEQANKRGKDLRVETGRMFRVYLNIKNPYRVRLDINSWKTSHIGLYLWSDGAITDAQWHEVENMQGDEYNEPGAIRLREILAENGIDGFVYPNGVEGEGDSYIALYDDQIVRTEAFPVKIQFSISEPVEKTKELIAIHNANWGDIRDAVLDWGGIPSPSIAIVKAQEGHTKYGDTSVIYPSAVVDPQTDNRNKIYGSDAWTPTKRNAVVEYEVNEDAVREFERTVLKLSEEVANGVFKSSSVVRNLGIDDTSEMGMDEVVQRLSGSDAVRAAYLAQKGEDITPEYRAKKYDRMGNDALRKYIDEVGERGVSQIAKKLQSGKRLSEAESETVRSVIRDAYAERNARVLDKRPESKSRRIEYYMKNNVTRVAEEDFVLHAAQFLDDGEVASDEIDKLATMEKLREATDKESVENWLRELAGGIFGERGIYNGEGRFDAAGNRKSYAETHMEYTADNIVRAMNQAKARGEGKIVHTGEGLIAEASPEYDSIEDVRGDIGRLQTVDDETYNAMRDALNELYNDVISDVIRNTKHHSDNTFEEGEIIGEVISEAAQGEKNVAGVKKTFRENGYTLSTASAENVLRLIEKAADMPTGYFEAKPQRVVGIDEAVAVIAPDSAPAEELAAVRNAGVNVLTYESGNTQQRVDLANSLNDVKFSISENAETESGDAGESAGDGNVDTGAAETVLEAENLKTMAQLVEEGEMFMAKYLDTPVKDAQSIRESMAPNVRKYLTRAENRLADSLSRATAISGGRSNPQVLAAARSIADKILTDGRILNADINRAYDALYADTASDGGEGEIYRMPRHDFKGAVMDAKEDLLRVKRAAEDAVRSETAGSKPKSARVKTVDEALKMYDEAKRLRRELAKTEAKTLLTQKDEATVGRLLRGEIPESSVKENREQVLAVYEARKAYGKVAGEIQDYKSKLHAIRNATAQEHLATSANWKDKAAGILYARETQERNVLDIVDDPDAGQKIIKEYFEPVHHAAAEANRLKNRMRGEVRAMNLSRKVESGNAVSEAAAVQILGEAQDNIRRLQKRGSMAKRDGRTAAEWNGVIAELKETNPNMDFTKIESAVKTFGEMYDELFEKMNEARVRNGYEPINYRGGYFPHFQSETGGDGVLANFGRALGIRTDVTNLPTTINGLTHTFKPGIQWFGHALERTGFQTTYDAVDGFDRYIDGAADVIYQTDNIQNLRALARQIRAGASDAAVKETIERIEADTSLDEEQKDALIQQAVRDQPYRLSNYVVNLDEYTNLLANKKSMNDRNMEYNLGRQMYNVVKSLESRVGANMVATNIRSAMTNFSPIVQGNAQMGHRGMLRGMLETLKSMVQDDGLAQQSDFLTNRVGTEALVQTKQEKLSQKAGFLMEGIDQFVAGSLVRARYYQNLALGMDADSAMRNADATAAGIMADRSKGALPTLFEQRSPVVKAFTQFQLEQNNLYSWLAKDLRRDKKTAKELSKALIVFLFGSYIFNDLFEKATGGRPQLDVLGMLNDFAGDLSGYELPNLIDLGIGAVTGDIPSFETEKEGIGGAVSNLVENVIDALPFAPLADALLTGDMDAGRIPIGGAVPDAVNLWSSVTNENYSAEKKLYEVGSELAKPVTYLALPFGGGQIKKTLEGLSAVIQGGVYGMDSAGEKQLKYPVYSDSVPGGILNTAQAVLMGKSSLPTAQEWADAGYPVLNAKQTACYQALVDDVGESEEAAYDLIMQIREAEKTDDLSKADAQRQMVVGSDLSGNGKAVVYCSLLATDKEMAVINGAADADLDMDKAVRILAEMHGAGGSVERLAILRGETLTSAEAELYASYIWGSDRVTESGELSRYGEFTESIRLGLSGSEAIRLASEDADLGAFIQYRDSGVQVESAVKIVEAMADLEPLSGESRVSAAQKWRVCVDNTSSDAEALSALQTVMTESWYRKASAATLYGVDPDTFVYVRELLPAYDSNGNGSYSNEEIRAAIDAMNTPAVALQRGSMLDTVQKAVLWQLYTGSTSAKNNPYSVAAGEKAAAALKKLKEGE